MARKKDVEEGVVIREGGRGAYRGACGSIRGLYSEAELLIVYTVWVWVELTPFGGHLAEEHEEETDDLEEEWNAGNNDNAHGETEGPESTRTKTRYRYWTSEDVRDIESFGYTYSELQDLHVNSSDDASTKKQVHSKEYKKIKGRKELERRVCAMYGRDVHGVLEVAGAVEEEGVEEERDGSNDQEEGERDQDSEDEKDSEGDGDEDRPVILSGNADPQPHLAPLPLPLPRSRTRIHPTPSPTPTRPKEKSKKGRGAQYTENAGSTSESDEEQRTDVYVGLESAREDPRV